MNAEYILDAIGLLDDGLIREAEEYRQPRRDYGGWIGVAASFAIIFTLGYGVFQFRNLGMSGGATAENQGAAGAPSGSSGWQSVLPGGSPSGGNEAEPSSSIGGESFPQGPVYGSEVGDWLFAIRVDGIICWATEEYVRLEPEENDIRYTTSFIDSAEPDEDGQANFMPVGTAYTVLEDGRVAVLQEDTGSWRVYDPVPPWEK